MRVRYVSVQYLYWQRGKAEGALAHAIAQFEDLARRDWVPKPHAEPDLLPRSVRPNTHQDTFLKTRGSSDEEATYLRELLHTVLKSVAHKVKVGDSFPILEESPRDCKLTGSLADSG